MNILVPIDFSEASLNALALANNIAQEANCNITCIHIVNTTHLINQGFDEHFYRQIKSDAMTRLRHFTCEYALNKSIRINEKKTNYIIDHGVPGSVILDIADTEDIDLIIMGIRDKLNFVARITGTTATYVMNNADIPVVLCHAHSEPKVPKKVVFAFDSNKEIEEGIKKFKKINNTLKANANFLHVMINDYDTTNDVQSNIVEKLFDDHNPVFGFSINSIKGEKPLHQIYLHCQAQNAGMLVMIHRNDSFIDMLFNNSKTIKAAYEFDIPILVLPD